MGIIHRCFIIAIIFHRVPINLPSVGQLVVSMNVQLESTWWATTWYCCPKLERTGNLPVWYVYIVSVGFYTWMNIYLFFSIGLLITGCLRGLEIQAALPPSRLKSVLTYCKRVASAGCGVFFFLVVLVVEPMFLCRLHIWPF